MMQPALLLAMAALLTSAEAIAPFIGREGSDVVITTGSPAGKLKVNDVDIMAEVYLQQEALPGWWWWWWWGGGSSSTGSGSQPFGWVLLCSPHPPHP